jgi:outer membrane protein OmpA-like peptidoglycan-associated protein
MKRIFVAAALAAASLSVPCQAQQSMFGVNLVENGGAEAGIGSPQCDTVRTPGWTTVGEFTVGTYGGRSDVLSSNSAGPPLFGANSRGKNFFCGGNGQSSQATQTIDVSSQSSKIDVGNVKFELSGWLGGDGTSDDNATLVVMFNGQNQLTGPIGTVKLGPVKAVDRSGILSLVFKQQQGIIPAGTRSISIGLDMQRVDGKLNDAYADNISFIMEPPTSQATSTSTISSGVSTSIATTGSVGGGTVTTANSGSNSSSSNNPSSFASGLGQFLGSFSAALANGGASNFNSGSNNLNTSVRNNSALSAIVHERGKTVVTLDSDKMFEQGKWALRPGTDQVLEQLRTTEFANHQTRPIFFEGHTDEVADNMDCLALSMMRSLAIVDWMAKHGVNSTQFEVRGCGKTLPKMMNINGMNRSQNRRVEIVLLE